MKKSLYAFLRTPYNERMMLNAMFLLVNFGPGIWYRVSGVGDGFYPLPILVAQLEQTKKSVNLSILHARVITKYLKELETKTILNMRINSILI